MGGVGEQDYKKKYAHAGWVAGIEGAGNWGSRVGQFGRR
jgi:hypothetical protein